MWLTFLPQATVASHCHRSSALLSAPSSLTHGAYVVAQGKLAANRLCPKEAYRTFLIPEPASGATRPCPHSGVSSGLEQYVCFQLSRILEEPCTAFFSFFPCLSCVLDS